MGINQNTSVSGSSAPLTTEIAHQDGHLRLSPFHSPQHRKGLGSPEALQDPSKEFICWRSQKGTCWSCLCYFPNPAHSVWDVVQRKPSAEWVPGIIHFHQYLLNPSWQDSLPPPPSLFPFPCTVCLISANHKLDLQSPLHTPPPTSSSKWDGKPFSHLWQAPGFWGNLILRD